MKSSNFNHCLLVIITLVLYCSCETKQAKTTENQNIEAITLLNDTLFTPVSTSESALNKFNLAKSDYEKNPQDADAIIMVRKKNRLFRKVSRGN
jgi:hypothetical protein